ncbi:MAG TPA: hypothetical protein VID49_01125 [Steroidobacteraceae bacterium]|jgi:hypothetical protein
MSTFWSRFLSVPRPDGAADDWRLLTTLPDLPSAQSLAEVLSAGGIPARVSSDAGVLGQAAPSRLYVSAPLLARAREYLAQGSAAAAPAADGTP